MATCPFLDTNVLVRLFAQDHEEHGAVAGKILDRIERGELQVRLSDTVIFETVFVLQSFYKWKRTSIRDALMIVIQLDGVELPAKEIYPDIFDLYVNRGNLSFADSFHAVLSISLDCNGLISFDTGFDKIPDFNRIPPGQLI